MDAVKPVAFDLDSADHVDQALVARVAAADRGEAAPPPGPVAPGAAANDQGAIAPDPGLVYIEGALYYGDIVRTMLPDHASRHWTDDRLRKLGEALARCAKHYNWQFGGAVTHPLAMLAAAGFPLTWPIAAPYVMPYIVGALKKPEPAPKPEETKPAPSSSSSVRPFPDLSEPPPKPAPAA